MEEAPNLSLKRSRQEKRCVQRKLDKWHYKYVTWLKKLFAGRVLEEPSGKSCGGMIIPIGLGEIMFMEYMLEEVKNILGSYEDLRKNDLNIHVHMFCGTNILFDFYTEKELIPLLTFKVDQ